MVVNTDRELGTWRLDVERSTFSPGPAHKSQMRTLEQVDDAQSLLNETITADGVRLLIRYTARFDGREYPVTGSPLGDAIVLRRIDGRTVEATVKKNGVTVVVDTRVVSLDGNTLTIAQVGTFPNGQPVNNVLVFERLRPGGATAQREG
jgi:hypothetical protein